MAGTGESGENFGMKEVGFEHGGECQMSLSVVRCPLSVVKKGAVGVDGLLGGGVAVGNRKAFGGGVALVVESAQGLNDGDKVGVPQARGAAVGIDGGDGG